MMNKALEVIEARFLFGLPAERLEVVIHPQSVIHSMVQYRDASVVAQLGTPDMRVPIAYGLAWPDRVESGAAALDFGTLADMSFESFDSRRHRERFPGLALAWEILRERPGSTAILNAANELAVAAFLERRIRFDQIHDVNLATLAAVVPSNPQSLDELLELDRRSRDAANRAIARLNA
jgi:1-deoxy-D-xylulose-5-phosphate reductoisomerase